MGIFNWDIFKYFDRKKWLDGLVHIDQKKIQDKKVWSNFDNTCLNAKSISSVFNKSDCYICAEPLSVNIIGNREWINLYDFVEIVRIPELLDYYRSKGMSF